MLSRRSIQKVREFNSQYGEGEDTFSPDWHERNPAPQEGGVLQAATEETIASSERVVRIDLQEVLEPNTVKGLVIDDATGRIGLQTFTVPEDSLSTEID